MVKKKHTEGQENKNKNHSEAFDNKDNTEIAAEETEFLTETSSETGQKANASSSEASFEEEPDKVVSEAKVLEAKLADMQDKYIRLSAEFDNYRKRTLKEKMEISKYAGEDILKMILPIIDDFERAIKHMVISPECSAMKEGIDLIYNKLSDFLTQQGIKEIDSLNCDFNVDLHDAVAQMPVETKDKKGKIVDVVLKGYYLKDKVIRHSKVVIGE